MLGLQLYTVRDKMKDEASAVCALNEIKNMGYECVQLAGNMETVEIATSACEKTGMRAVGILVGMNECESFGEELFACAKRCGATDIGISSGMKTEAEAFDIINRANAFAKKAKEQGFSFSYHNHSNEFIRGESGKTLMQLLLEGFECDLVKLMPDTYWLQHGGVDVRAFLEYVSGRVKILHLKDMKRTPEGPTFSEIGAGNMNFKGILSEAKKIGVEHFIVEQDKCACDSLDAAHISCEFLRKIL